MNLLLDPLLLAPPGSPGEPLPANSEFWQCIVEWASDRRAKLGPESHAVICEQYAQYGYPANNLEFGSTALRRDYQTALGRLLSRVLPYVREPGERDFEPGYMGNEHQSLALQFDIVGTMNSVAGLATSASNWSFATDHVTLDPPQPPKLPLCMVAGSELAAERQEAVFKFFKGVTLHIVGARPESPILERLALEIGIAETDIRWLACERARPPRDLDARWSGLAPKSDVTVCITGRVGHATSAKAQRAAKKADVVHLQVETPTKLVDALCVYSQSI